MGAASHRGSELNDRLHNRKPPRMMQATHTVRQFKLDLIQDWIGKTPHNGMRAAVTLRFESHSYWVTCPPGMSTFDFVRPGLHLAAAREVAIKTALHPHP